MSRSSYLLGILLITFIAPPPLIAAPPKKDIQDIVDEGKARREAMRAAGVPEIYIHTRYIQVDTDMYDIFIEGYQPSEEGSNELPSLPTKIIHVVPKDGMREVTDIKSNPIPFGMRHFFADLRDGYVFEGVVLDGVAEVKMGTTNYEFNDNDMPRTFPEDPAKSNNLIGVDFLGAPKLLVSNGQAASMSSGYTRPYLIKGDDGCLQLPEFNDFTDGTYLYVAATLQDDDNILLEPLTTSFTQMVGREKIEGVPLDVGKPIVQTAYMSMSLIMSQKATAVFALPRFDENAPVILVLIRTYVAPAKPESKTAPKASNAE